MNGNSDKFPNLNPNFLGKRAKLKSKILKLFLILVETQLEITKSSPMNMLGSRQKLLKSSDMKGEY